MSQTRSQNDETVRPLVTIITPSFNQGNFIADAIRSIKGQTYPYIEHIIIDGASNDNTLDIIKSFDGSYNMRWLSEPDTGMYDAINKGLQLANGKIIAYLNCDDMYFPWSVNIAVNALTQHKIVFGDAMRLNMDYNNANIVILPPFVSSYYRSIGFIVQPTVFFKREVLDSVGSFDSQFRYLGDVEYWLRCDAAGIKPAKVWECLAIERMHSHSQNSRFKARLAEEERSVRNRYVGWPFRFSKFYSAMRSLFWRAVFIGLKYPWLPGWSELKRSGVITLGWQQYIEQLTPRLFKSPYKFSPYIDVDRVFELMRGLKD